MTIIPLNVMKITSAWAPKQNPRKIDVVSIIVNRKEMVRKLNEILLFHINMLEMNLRHSDSHKIFKMVCCVG